MKEIERVKKPDSHPSRWPAVVLALCLAVFAIINLGNALHKGGDFAVFLEAGNRILDGRPVYEGSGPGSGVIGPPFHAVFFAPFAWLSRLNLTAAKLTWYIVNLSALFAGIWLWALTVFGHETRVKIWLSSPVLLAALAILLPVQTNFEHQNMNPLLLCILGGGAYAMRRRREWFGGGLFGLAAALKAFPGFLVLYLIARRKWKAAAAAVVCAVVLTLLPIVRNGPEGAFRLMRQWLAVNEGGGWPVRPQNQSVYAVAHRLFTDSGTLIAAVVTMLIVGFVLFIALRRRLNEPVIAAELALAIAVSVLVSPIAWDHYWVLMFPAFLMVAAEKSRVNRAVFVMATVLVSGLSPVILGAAGFQTARALGAGTAAGMMLVAAVTAPLLVRGRSGKIKESRSVKRN